MVHPVWEPGLGVGATGISCVARSSELRAVRVDNGTGYTLQVHLLPRRVRTHNDMLKECSRGDAHGHAPLSSGVTSEWEGLIGCTSFFRTLTNTTRVTG
jgi:hypothetical protein